MRWPRAKGLPTFWVHPPEPTCSCCCTFLQGPAGADDDNGWVRSLVLGIVQVSVSGASCQPVAWDGELTVTKRGCTCTSLTPSGNLCHKPSTVCSNPSILYRFETSATLLCGHMLVIRFVKCTRRRACPRREKFGTLACKCSPKHPEKCTLKDTSMPCRPSIKSWVGPIGEGCKREPKG